MVRKKLFCDCGDTVYQGVPCCHLLAIVVKNQGAEEENLPFNKRWELRYYVRKNEEKESNDFNLVDEEEKDKIQVN